LDSGAYEHTFAIPVYAAAKHLGALVDSLRAQSASGSQILLTTSTPSPQLELFARERTLPLHVNPQRLDIAADWNFALAAASTNFVTIAHQDDLYADAYVARFCTALRRYPQAQIAFCDYREHTLGGPRSTNLNLRIKRMLCRHAFGSREILVEPREKMRLLSLGNPVCCPSVMFNRRQLGHFSFPGGFKTNLDWMAWLQLARQPGGFVYLRDKLVSKGVHAESETSVTLANDAREAEDRRMFEEVWSPRVAHLLMLIYRWSYRANRVRGSFKADT
jgi:hypothetical protein